MTPHVRIPRVRRCKNPYRNCGNFARKQTGNAYEDKICDECLARRREKQAMTRQQPICRCGNKMGFGASQCRGCDWKDDEAEKATQRRRDQLKADLDYIAENDPQAIEDAFNSLMRDELRSLRRDYP